MQLGLQAARVGDRQTTQRIIIEQEDQVARHKEQQRQASSEDFKFVRRKPTERAEQKINGDHRDVKHRKLKAEGKPRAAHALKQRF